VAGGDRYWPAAIGFTSIIAVFAIILFANTSTTGAAKCSNWRKEKRTSRKSWTSCRKKAGKQEPSPRGSAEGAKRLIQSGESQQGVLRQKCARRQVAVKTLVQEKRLRLKLTLGPVVFGETFAVP
jgi:ribosomal protein S4